MHLPGAHLWSLRGLASDTHLLEHILGKNLNLLFPGQTVDDTHHTRESMGA